MPENTIQLSVIIICKNEAHSIKKCIDSSSFADEVIVLDSGSTDQTMSIARSLGARVAVSDGWPGFGPQKNRALSMARGRWVLSLDADEEISPELRDEIKYVIHSENLYKGYWVRRRSFYCGKLIQHGDWRNDRVLRLFQRTSAKFSDDLVHERILCPEPHGILNGYLWHYSVDSRSDFEEKVMRYARIGAENLRSRGKGGPLSAIVHAFWSFFRGYILRGGFLDGLAGLDIALLNARGTFKRYLLAGTFKCLSQKINHVE